MNKLLNDLVKFGYIKEALIKGDEAKEPPKVDANQPQNTNVSFKQVEKGFQPEENPEENQEDEKETEEPEDSAEPDTSGSGEKVEIPKEMVSKIKTFIAMAKELEELLPKEEGPDDESSDEESPDADTGETTDENESVENETPNE